MDDKTRAVSFTLAKAGLASDSGQRTAKTDRWFLQSPGMADKGHHVFTLPFSSEALEGQCVLESGEVRDRFSRPLRQ